MAEGATVHPAKGRSYGSRRGELRERLVAPIDESPV